MTILNNKQFPIPEVVAIINGDHVTLVANNGAKIYAQLLSAWYSLQKIQLYVSLQNFLGSRATITVHEIRVENLEGLTFLEMGSFSKKEKLISSVLTPCEENDCYFDIVFIPGNDNIELSGISKFYYEFEEDNKILID